MFERLDRRYTILAAIVSVLVFAVVVLTATAGQKRTIESADRIRASYARQSLVREYLAEVLEAESAQRGFLLTHDERYLAPYRASRAAIDSTLNALRMAIEQTGGDAGALANVRDLRGLTGEKLGELESTVALDRAGDADAALALIRTDLGKRAMDQMRETARAIEFRELQLRQDIEARAARDLWVTRLVTVAGGGVNVALVLVAGLLLRRAIDEQALLASRVASENVRLEHEVAERTETLYALSSHLQDVSEQERSQLARELHDELGGLLIAVKIDLTTLRRRGGSGDADLQARWDRVFATLDTGLNLKRRVVEQLRPTLLDNMGLYAALRWQFQESCGRSGLQCTEELPEHELPISAQASIALFRIAQESMTNIVKHAKATEAALSVEVANGELVLRVADNGVGIDAQKPRAAATHGLASMQHRVRVLGGTWSLGPRGDGRGVVIEVRVPLERIQTAPA